jgi:transposase InsO family protein
MCATARAAGGSPRRLPRLSVRQEFIMPYTPEQNGLVERFFRSPKEECVVLVECFLDGARTSSTGSVGLPPSRRYAAFRKRAISLSSAACTKSSLVAKL